MKKLLAIFISAALCLSSFMQTSSLGAVPSFNDISGHWAENEIDVFYNGGIISGYPDGSFLPDRNVTRAEFATIIARAFDLSEESPINYPDVNESEWYYPYLKFSSPYIGAFELDDISFAGNHNVYKVDIYAALVEIILYKQRLEIDIPTIDEIYEHVRRTFPNDMDFQANDIRFLKVQRNFKYVWLADYLDILYFESNGSFYPYNPMTRAELVFAIYNIQELLKN